MHTLASTPSQANTDGKARALVLRATGLTALALPLASPATAEIIGTTVSGSYVESIQSAGVTVPRSDLRPGVSEGTVLDHPWGTTIRSADGRNLESYFIRNGPESTWEVTFGSWTPGPGAAADFFLYDVGGNDSASVRARFANGSLGAPVALSGWSPTTVLVDGGPNAGQRVYGLGFRFEDLRQGSGQPILSTQRVVGMQILSDTVDGAAFLVRDPGASAGQDGDGSWEITPAQPRAASPMELSFAGPFAAETDEAPNPFLDYRMTVRFDGPAGRSMTMPGFFDADGVRGDAGNRWAVRFLPPTPGTWTATISMRFGAGAAIAPNDATGIAVPSMHGQSFQFTVGTIKSEAEGFFRVGNLRDVGKHHRKFENGPYYLKTGTNGPENFLALRALDDTTKSGGEGNLHSFAPHIGDWRAGDPILSPGNDTDDGKGTIGALNYLSDEGVNSLFLMVMNLGGDGNDVYPFLGPKRRTFEKRHYDTSRLRQWNVIFEHAQRRGISLSLVMNETELENELWLDNGGLGVERKLFYREMVARFGHHPAIKWNICEENDYSVAQLTQFADRISALDADQHPIAIHNNPNDLALFQQLVGNPNFDAASLQFDPNQADAQVEQVRQWTAQAGRPWLVDADEMGPWQIGLTDTNATDTRRRILYDALFSGGGVEFYFGWHDLPLGGDLSLEDFRTRGEMWTYMRHARSFIEGNLPFWDMDPQDNLLRNEPGDFGGGEVFALLGETYAVYLPRAGTSAQLNLIGQSGTFELSWYNPRTGSFVGATSTVDGGTWRNLGGPPSDINNDWVALVRRGEALEPSIDSGSLAAGDVQVLQVQPGPPYAGRSYVLVSSLAGPQVGFDLGAIRVPIDFDRWSRYALTDSANNVFEGQLGVLDSAGRGTIRVKLDPAFINGLVGTTMYHAVVLTNPYDYVSNVVELTVLP